MSMRHFRVLLSTPAGVGLGLAAAILWVFLLAWLRPGLPETMGGGFVYQDQDERKSLWEKVDKAMGEGLPQTAIEHLDAIRLSALKDGADVEGFRALVMKFAFAAQLDQPAAPKMIRQLEEAMPTLAQNIQPLAHGLLANWYYSYFQQNRWRFAQRSQTSAPPSDDFETWDLPKFLERVDQLYRTALQDEVMLQSLPISDFRLLLSGEAEEAADQYRPTLFDFLAFQALEFYSLDEHIVRQQSAFDLTADSPALSSLDLFLQWSPETEDTDSYLLQAITLYQRVLRSHAADQDPSALLDADLQRLAFAHQMAKGSEKDVRYMAALQRFADDHPDHELSALALARLAQLTRNAGEMQKAHQLAKRGLAVHPNSRGGAECQSVINEIEAKELRIQAERLWNSAGPSVEVNARNIEKVHFRLIAFDYQNWQWGRYRDAANMEHPEKLKLSERPAVAEWTVDLPAGRPFESVYNQSTPMPEVPSGSYLLLASATKDFRADQNQLSVCEVWVSELMMILREDYTSPQLVGQLVNALDGRPQSNATIAVQSWRQEGRESRTEQEPSITTDENGFFRLQREQRKIYLLSAKVEQQQFAQVVSRGYYGRQNDENSLLRQTHFFTDRSIYRPGQTIQFKAIAVETRPNEGRYQTRAGQQLKIGLWDANNQLIEQMDLRTNEFGSVSGSFTAPRDRGTGMMRIGTLESPFNGGQVVRVEEYKRPKFYAEMSRPEQQFRLNEEVTVAGKAASYTGAPIDGAKVSYRVVREVRFPAWWMWRCWFCPPMQGQSQEIANGITETNVEGQFQVKFEAVPDAAADRAGQPTFTYTIYADVTDSTGETRSATTNIRLGYTSLEAYVQVGNWLTTHTPVEIQGRVANLDGRPQSVAGKMTVRRLQPPAEVQRASAPGQYGLRYDYFSRMRASDLLANGSAVKPDLSKIESWPEGDAVAEVELKSDEQGQAKQAFELPVGAYRVKWEATDEVGNVVFAEQTFQVIDPTAKKFATPIPHYLDAESWSVEPGQTFRAIWGTGYSQGPAFVQWIHRGKVLKEFWTDPSQTQIPLEFTPSEEHRGGLQLILNFVRDNRVYQESRRIDVPWTSKQLQVKWERFVSKLQPGAKETWTAIVTGPDAKAAVGEMVATLYDASLDAFAGHQYPSQFGMFYTDYLRWGWSHTNRMQELQTFHYGWSQDSRYFAFQYRQFDYRLVLANYDQGRMFFKSGAPGRAMRGMGGGGMVAESAAMADAAPIEELSRMEGARADSLAVAPSGGLNQAAENSGDLSNGADAPGPDLDQVATRQNLNETAFFFPHVMADEQGTLRLEFQMPEALTRWKFLGFVHDTQMRAGLLTDEVVTSKDLMVQPNPPRFLREGDVLEFSAKIINQSATRQAGRVRLTLSDLETDQAMSEAFGLSQPEQAFDVPAGQSVGVYWRLTVPEYSGVVGYKIVGATDRLSDGEEGFLPVLSRRVLVTESLPLPIRGKSTKTFEFKSLLESKDSDSLRHQSLTVQMTSNPTWYAVMALPYLMENPYPSSESIFSRLYANALGHHMVTGYPRIAEVFKQWEGTDALDSPLEKNEEIRSILIQQTPWLIDAKQESQVRRRVALLFQANRLTAEIAAAQKRLAEMQYEDGSWPWCPGGSSSDYMTLYIVTGLGRLRHLGVQLDPQLAVQALGRIDQDVLARFKELERRGVLKQNNLSSLMALYLYGRSFFLQDQPIADESKVAYEYFLEQSRQHWLSLNNRLSQGHVALALKRFGDVETPGKIVASLRERSLSDEEMGRFWREGQRGWRWFEAPIESQAMMIEVFDEVAADKDFVEDLKVWLLKQKQTQNWDTSTGTADAIYALLLRGSNQLASRQRVTVQVGSTLIQPQVTEAGTGFYQERLVKTEVQAEMGTVQVTKEDDGVAWGSVHWQYLEDISKIKAFQETPLTVTKTLYRKVNSPNGPVIEPVAGQIEVGDQVVVRLELRTDRDLEYVHLKDDRGSGTEPVDVISRYQYQDGFGYYQSTRDTASHFFIEYLPRGVYVFEYSVRVQHRGQYQTGMALVECLYAPEFKGHSASLSLEVK